MSACKIDGRDFREASYPAVPTPANFQNNALTVANLGHATLLMNYFGVRVLSDPVLFERVGFTIDSVLTIGPHRLIEPPLRPDQLGPIDVILITHAHMDHLDIRSLKALPRSTTVIACEQCGRLINPLGFYDVRELKWGQTTVVKNLTITALGAAHWGTRWPPFGRSYGFNSYLLNRDGVGMFLACDSADTNLFARLHDHPPEVAAFSIAAYDPWIRNHANPEQVWRMFTETGARYLIPIHWGTFRLSKEPIDEPMRRLLAAAGDASGRVVLRSIGGTWTLPAAVRTRTTDATAR
ncbi:MAG: MBL fold metallo-hydrolase [Candidatus Binataceae bacterium]|nr:MBL fold metallo-hydrolase [Candidatus Binataceae bacterium]